MSETIELLRRRRSLRPEGMAGPGPGLQEIETLSTIASRLPDHRKLTPRRFLIFEGAARRAAGAIRVRDGERITGFAHIARLNMVSEDRWRPALADVVSRFPA